MQYNEATARCWLEVDLDMLDENVRSAQALLGEARLIPVLKGNAYGMGAIAIGKHLAHLELLAVATVQEGLALKRALPDTDIFVMGPSFGSDIDQAVEHGLIISMYTSTQALRISDACKLQNRIARVHVKMNTGLNRIGFDDPMDALSAMQLPGINPIGVFTHLALHNQAADRAQLNRLQAAISIFERHGYHPPIVHALDSIGMVRYPNDHMDGARLGAWLYGVKPKGYEGGATCKLICKFKARIAQLRDVKSGEFIGYDDDHPLQADAKIATIACGYADGYPRLTASGYALVNGKKAPLRGLVCMDQFSVDVTGIDNVHEGMAVTLLGDALGIDEYAAWLNLNRNDALSRISRRVARVYYKQGICTEIVDHV